MSDQPPAAYERTADQPPAAFERTADLPKPYGPPPENPPVEPDEAPVTRGEMGALHAKLDALLRLAPAVPKTLPVKDPDAPAPIFKVGQTVVHTYEGMHGVKSQTGVVASVLDGDGDEGPRVTVAWYAGISGPIDNRDLAAL